MTFRSALLAGAITATMAIAALPGKAHAIAILTFGQTTDGDTITAIDDGTTTNIDGTAIPITVSQFVAGGAPFGAVLDIHLVSNGVISTVAGNLIESFSGSTTIMQGSTIVLNAVFNDTVFTVSGSASIVLTASQPPGSVVYTSDLVDPAQLFIPFGVALGFADVNPLTSVDGTTLAAFHSSVAGTYSAEFVPEPISLSVMGAGLLGLGYVRRRRA